ncbi:hypothetical protein GUJ93_ZPchr0009g2296 [Zizania palustris]|uniref:Uncharacterized protein n=1 Tax=Zizania palustris TaxID=103762 RepID=A0A8J5UXZ7_ZIZPA|nr:hypothetical protein GUJ93_ZPchr0009g2296 [Zizania palustris]
MLRSLSPFGHNSSGFLPPEESPLTAALSRCDVTSRQAGGRLLGFAHEELENRRKLQHLGEFDRCPGQFRHRGSGIRDVELRLVFHGHSVRQFLSQISCCLLRGPNLRGRRSNRPLLLVNPIEWRLLELGIA